MKRTKTQKGITLVALIITIVVLLLLAMVSISAIQNEGVMSQAQSAVEKFNESQTNEEVTLGGYDVLMNKYGDVSSDTNGDGDAVNTYAAYSKGDSVTVGGEEFWVIQNSGTAEANVVLLAKKAIDTTNLVQSATPNQIAFSESMYWEDDGVITEATVPPDASHYAARAAYEYGKKIGGDGRLLAADEAVSLINWDESGNQMVSSCLINGTWLKLARENEGLVMVVLGDGYFSERTQEYNSVFTVRPVVTIAKDKIG